MDTLVQDLRYAVRMLLKAPAFTVVALLTLALGIGANTVIFSVVDAVLLRPLPFRDSERLVVVWERNYLRERGSHGVGRNVVGPANFVRWREQNHVFDGVIASSDQDVLYTSGEGTERFEGYLVTPGTFEFFGMPPLVGRAMQPADYEPGAPPVFVLRYKVWVSRFNRDASILNTQFVLNGTSRTLIGVMPPRFAWGDADLWIPEKPSRARAGVGSPLQRYWFLLGHLRPGVTMRQAEADLDVVAHRLAAAYDKDYPKTFKVEVQSLVGDIALDGGRPKLHAHVVLGRRDMSTLGGHLLKAIVRPTLEVLLTDGPEYLRREHDPQSGLALIRVGR